MAAASAALVEVAAAAVTAAIPVAKLTGVR